MIHCSPGFFCHHLWPDFAVRPAPSAFRQALLDNDTMAALALMESGAAPIVEGAGNNLKLAISRDCDLDVIKKMIARANVNAVKEGGTKSSVIHVAARSAHAAAVGLLIQAKASLLARDCYGRSPLFYAVVLSAGLNRDYMPPDKILATVRVLLANGAPVNHELPKLALLPRYCVRYQEAFLTIDPRLVTLLAAEGAGVPDKKWVRDTYPTQAAVINGALQEGVWCRDAPSIATAALGLTLPASLLGIIRDYMYQPISPSRANA